VQELSGRVAVVTGASRGIGRAVAIALASEGAKVIVNFQSNEAAAGETVAAIVGAGGEAVAMRFDVSRRRCGRAAMKEVVAACGGIHILVNNAGVAVNGLTLGGKDADFRRALDVNLGGTFNCTRAALRSLMRAPGGGRIINIASIVGEAGSAGQGAYAAAKAGIIGLTKSWAREYASRGLTVNAVSPGHHRHRHDRRRNAGGAQDGGAEHDPAWTLWHARRRGARWWPFWPDPRQPTSQARSCGSTAVF
jgi:3-oxoacyl-[acyl-carrier protein] reductase